MKAMKAVQECGLVIDLNIKEADGALLLWSSMMMSM
jgi:hypothetical protein